MAIFILKLFSAQFHPMVLDKSWDDAQARVENCKILKRKFVREFSLTDSEKFCKHLHALMGIFITARCSCKNKKKLPINLDINFTVEHNFTVHSP